MMLSPIEKAYQALIFAYVTTYEIHDNFSMSLDSYFQSPWLGSSDSLGPFNEAFLAGESITEVMSLKETPCNDARHRSLFFQSLYEISSYLETLFSSVPTHLHQPLVLVHEVLSEGNMGNILETMPSYISIQLSIFENFHLGAYFSRDELNIFASSFMRLSHEVFTIHPFPQWRIDFLTRNPHSSRAHGGLIIIVYHYTNWLSQCLHVIPTLKIWFYYILIDYQSPKVGSI